MKRPACICLGAACLLLFSGCQRTGSSENSQIESASSTDSLTCSNGTQEMSFTSLNDKVLTSQLKFRISAADLGLAPENDNAAALQNAANAVNQSYNDLQGVTASSSVDGDGLQVLLVIDYRSADLGALIERGLITQAETESQFVSADKTKSTLEQGGFACSVE